MGAYQPDDCPKVWGNSTSPGYGCLDSDGDGRSDDFDSCIWDPEIYDFNAEEGVECEITKDPAESNTGSDGSKSKSESNFNPLIILSIIAVILLAGFLVAMLAKQAAKRSGKVLVSEHAMSALLEQKNDEVDERRQQWIDYYVQVGQLDKAKELGWVDPAAVPEWQKHQQQEQAEQDAAVPTMVSLDDVL